MQFTAYYCDDRGEMRRLEDAFADTEEDARDCIRERLWRRLAWGASGVAIALAGWIEGGEPVAAVGAIPFDAKAA